MLLPAAVQWVDAAGGPVAGLDVWLKDENGNWLRSTTTGAQAEAIFTIAPGVYSFAVDAPQPLLSVGRTRSGAGA